MLRLRQGCTIDGERFCDPLQVSTELQRSSHLLKDSVSKRNFASCLVQKKDFPSMQFFVVFVIKPEDYACGGSIPSSIRGKRTGTNLVGESSLFIRHHIGHT